MLHHFRFILKQKNHNMKQLLIFLFITLSFSSNSKAQLRLNITGDAKIYGKLILGSTARMFIGHDAGLNNTGGFNVFIGPFAGTNNTTGQVNTFVGISSGASNSIGDYNTFLGLNSGMNNTTGGSNTFLGIGAGASNNTGGENTFLGAGAGMMNRTGRFNTCIGLASNPDTDNLENSTSIGYNARALGSNKIRIGNDNITEIGGIVAWSNLSDKRYKKNISVNKNGLDFILALKPVQYNYNVVKMVKERKESALKEHQKAVARSTKDNSGQEINIPIPELSDYDYMEKTARKNSKIVYTGFLAQEVEQAMENTGYVFSGVVKPENEQQTYALRYAEFVVPLVDAVQQQQQIIEKLKMENEVVKETNEALLERLNQLEDRVAKLVANNLPTSTQNKKIYAAKLEQNLPNPFEGVTKLPYYIPQDSRTAQMKIYNLSGQLLETINIGQFGKGEVLLEIDGFSAGQYHYSLEVDGQVIDTKKMNLQ